MNNVSRTRHASKRMQQRAISELTLQLIEAFGTSECQSGGTEIAYIPKKRLAKLRDAIDRADGVMAVLDRKGVVITAMHRTRRIRVKGNA